MALMLGDPYTLFDEMEADIADAMRDVGEKIAIDIKDRISVPVGYRIGPRGGVVKIRSRRGEPPRKDTGRLQKEIASDVIAAQGQVEGSVYAKTPYAGHLENELNRPIMTDASEVYDDLIADGATRAANGE